MTIKLTTFAVGTLATCVIAFPAAAQESRTRSYEGNVISSEATTTVDAEAGTVDRNRTTVNKETGETASANYNRTRTENGSEVSGSRTGFDGNGSSFQGERVRNGDGTGSTFTGTATGRRGETYGLNGQRSRDGQGNNSTSQSVTNSAGETIRSRSRATTRSDGNVSRTFNRSPRRRPR